MSISLVAVGFFALGIIVGRLWESFALLRKADQIWKGAAEKSENSKDTEEV